MFNLSLSESMSCFENYLHNVAFFSVTCFVVISSYMLFYFLFIFLALVKYSDIGEIHIISMAKTFDLWQQLEFAPVLESDLQNLLNSSIKWLADLMLEKRN